MGGIPGEAPFPINLVKVHQAGESSIVSNWFPLQCEPRIINRWLMNREVSNSFCSGDSHHFWRDTRVTGRVDITPGSTLSLLGFPSKSKKGMNATG